MPAVKALGLLLCATTACVACSSETARPPALGACVPERDASCVALPAAATMMPGEAGSTPSAVGDGAPSAAMPAEGGFGVQSGEAGRVGASGEAGIEGGLATVADSGTLPVGSAEGGSPSGTGSE
ncbi:MAG: hypothetical protein M3O36_08255 [Myxococcota bacterium]|nr:hypothetical protein [Myxococcota bacterium]